jgi:hypothetical protein
MTSLYYVSVVTLVVTKVDKSKTPNEREERDEARERVVWVFGCGFASFIVHQLLLSIQHNLPLQPIKTTITMSASLFARNLARRTFERTLLTKVAPQFGAVRFSSYFTPGKRTDLWRTSSLVSLPSLIGLTLYLFQHHSILFLQFRSP